MILNRTADKKKVQPFLFFPFQLNTCIIINSNKEAL